MAWQSADLLRDLSSSALSQEALESEQGETGHSRYGRRHVLAGLAAAAVAGIFPLMKFIPSGWDEYSTQVGERRDIRLADGSILHLNTATSLAVKLDADHRRIRLHSGEASFDVAHDKARPFDVEAQGSTVRAVGTSFNIRLRGASVELTVSEGVVAVRRAERTVKTLSAGSAALIQSQAVALKALSRNEMSQRMAWHRDMIELNGDSVEQAVAEFNRYRKAPLLIEDARVGDLRIGGRFSARDADNFLVALENSLPIGVIRNADGSVMLIHSAGE